MLALLLGMQAKERAKSTLLSECEVNSFKWMKSSILTGGLVAMKDICSSEEDKETETSCLGDEDVQQQYYLYSIFCFILLLLNIAIYLFFLCL